jgi:hypothetical protein
MTPQPKSNTQPDKDRLTLLEATIERGLSTFIEVGNALVEIRDDRLYRERGFHTFEDYCRQRWGFGRNYANKQIAASRLVQNLGTTVPKSVTEGQVRELARLPPEQQREVAATIDFTKATAKDIHVAVEQRAAQQPKATTPEKEIAEAAKRLRQKDDALDAANERFATATLELAHELAELDKDDLAALIEIGSRPDVTAEMIKEILATSPESIWRELQSRLSSHPLREVLK